MQICHQPNPKYRAHSQFENSPVASKKEEYPSQTAKTPCDGQVHPTASSKRLLPPQFNANLPPAKSKVPSPFPIREQPCCEQKRRMPFTNRKTKPQKLHATARFTPQQVASAFLSLQSMQICRQPNPKYRAHSQFENSPVASKKEECPSQNRKNSMRRPGSPHSK
jgi:hypothetical protein